MVKNKYFKDNENVDVLEGGIMKLNDEEIEKVEGKKIINKLFLLEVILQPLLIFFC